MLENQIPGVSLRSTPGYILGSLRLPVRPTEDAFGKAKIEGSVPALALETWPLAGNR